MHGGSTSCPVGLPKAPPPKTIITSGIKISTCELEGESHVLSMAWPIQSTLSGQMRKRNSSPGRLPAPCPTCALDVWSVEEGGVLLPGPHTYLLAGATS